MTAIPTPPTTPPSPWGLSANEELLLTLARSLHEAGQPAHRLEGGLLRVAERLGVSLQVFSLPTGMFLTLFRSGAPVTVVLRSSPMPPQLEKLRRVSAVTHELARGTLAPMEAHVRLAELRNAGPRWRGVSVVLGYVLSAAAFSVFFQGGIRELLISLGVGLAVGVVAAFFPHLRNSGRLFELIAATAAGVVAGSADAMLGRTVNWIPLASGLVILLPGMSLVDALEELANGHLASGGARMAGVGVAFLALIFGVMLGVGISDPGTSTRGMPEVEPFPWWMAIPALLAVTAGSMIRFQADWRDSLWILIATTVAFVDARLGTEIAGPYTGPFLGALVLGLCANLCARLWRVVPELMLVPGLAVLVPGAFGLRSLGSFLLGDSTVGVEEAFRMFVLATGIVAGLLFSNAVARERSE